MRQLATLRMKSSLGPSRLAHWLRRVFLEWVAQSVGAQERRDRKIKKCVQRRREVCRAPPLAVPGPGGRSEREQRRRAEEMNE